MTEPIKDDAPAPFLETMIGEVRAEQPDVDWAKVEARLFDDAGEVRAQLQPRHRRLSNRSSKWAVVAGGLALAAAFAIAIVSPTHTVENVDPHVASATERAPLLEGGAPKAVGTKIDGGTDGVWLRSIGRISIHFEPGAQGVLLDDGERVRVSLESGALAADVVPVPGGEPFAVDVAGKRVAVHGTHLRVAIVSSPAGAGVEVAVSEGSAVVGLPAGEGRTEGPLVEAGSVGTFGASASIVRDPARASSIVEGALGLGHAPAKTVAVQEPPSLPPTVISPPAPNGGHPGPAIAPSVAKTAEPPKGAVAPPAVANGLSDAELTAPLAKVDAAVKACLQLPPTVGFDQTLTFEIAPTGKITDWSVSAIAPENRDCVRNALAKITFPTAGAKTITSKRIVLAPK